MALKRRMSLLLIVVCLMLCCCGAAVAESALQFDSSREVAAYLDEVGRKYAGPESSGSSDKFLLRYTPSEATELEAISVSVYVYEDYATVAALNLLQPDTSDMLKLYQTLESINESVSFVRFVYDAKNNVIYSRADIPYVADASFGQMVERCVYLTARVVDEHYNDLTALKQ